MAAVTEKIANDVETTITVAASGSTTGTVASASNLPAVPFRAVIQASATSATGREYVTVTAVAGTTVTISRAVEDATRYPAAAHSAGSYFSPIMTVQGIYNSLYVRPEAWGAVGDGTTDDTTAINAAITAANAAGGGTVLLSDTYVATIVVLKSFVRLLGNGRGKIQKTGGTGAECAIAATGTLGTGVNLNANAAASVTSVTAATNPASLVAGDYVVIRDNTYKYGAGPTAQNTEINRLTSVTGSGPFTFTLATPTLASYATASTAQIIKLNAVVDAAVESLYVEVPVGTDGGCIGLTYTTGFTVEDCFLKGFSNQAGVQTNTSSRVRIIDSDFRDAQMPDVNHGFGVAIDNSHHVLVSGNHFENYMENLFSNNARDGYFLNNVCVGPHDSGINSHGSGNERLLFCDNIITGSLQYGIAIGHSIAPATDRDISVARNLIADSQSIGIVIQGNASGPIVMREITVTDNVIVAWDRANSGTDAGIYCTQGVDLHIVSNVLDGYSLAASQTGMIFATVTDALVQDNTFRNMANAWGMTASSTTRLTVRANQFSAIASDNIHSGGSNTTMIVRDNVADDASNTRGAGERWEGNNWGGQTDPTSSSYVVGSTNVSTGHFMTLVQHLVVTGTQRLALQGTARLRIL